MYKPAKATPIEITAVTAEEKSTPAVSELKSGAAANPRAA